MKCGICGVELTQEDVRAPTMDCGGDCLRCMADSGDPDCIEAMHELEPDNSEWFQEQE
jgi:hypothetical protein